MSIAITQAEIGCLNVERLDPGLTRTFSALSRFKRSSMGYTVMLQDCALLFGYTAAYQEMMGGHVGCGYDLDVQAVHQSDPELFWAYKFFQMLRGGCHMSWSKTGS